MTPILRQIITNAKRNVCKYPTQQRHTEILKKFAIALFIYCGPLLYKFIYQNTFQVLPSLRSVQRIIHSQYKIMGKSTFRFDELSKHITDYTASRIVSIGEDATRMIRSRVETESASLTRI